MKTKIDKDILLQILSRIEQGVVTSVNISMVRDFGDYKFFIVDSGENHIEFRRKIPGTNTFIHIVTLNQSDTEFVDIYLQGNITRKWIKNILSNQPEQKEN